MPENLKVLQIGSSPLPPPFRGLHSPGVRKHCQIIFACYFRKSSIVNKHCIHTVRFSARVYQSLKHVSEISSLLLVLTYTAVLHIGLKSTPSRCLVSSEKPTPVCNRGFIGSATFLGNLIRLRRRGGTGRERERERERDSKLTCLS